MKILGIFHSISSAPHHADAVDNAIVVADGILVRVREARDRPVEVVKQTQAPLLGATIIAAIAFAPIGLSPDSTGEFCRSLFQVVGISLLLSWVLAVTVTPLAAAAVLRGNAGGEASDPYGSRFYAAYRRFLSLCLARRRAVLLLTAALTAASFIGFGYVDKSFFPPSSTPMFTVDFWTQRGTSLEATMAEVVRMEEFLLSRPGTGTVSSYAGEGALRFILTYTPDTPASNYGHLIVTAKDSGAAETLKGELASFVRENQPHLDPRIRSFAKGTGGGAKVQVRFLGKDPAALRRAAGEAAIYASDGRDKHKKRLGRAHSNPPGATDSVQLLGSPAGRGRRGKMAFPLRQASTGRRSCCPSWPAPGGAGQWNRWTKRGLSALNRRYIPPSSSPGLRR